MKHRFSWTSTLISLLLVLALALPWAVLADPLVNLLDTSVDPALETVTISSGSSVTIRFYILASNTAPVPDASGCNATGSSPAYLTLVPPTGVSVTWAGYPAALEFQGCGATAYREITFSSSTAGSYTINGFSLTGGKTGSGWDYTAAHFTLNVTSPDSTPPVIVPTVGPTPNAAGWNNADVTVSWSVSDAESGIASSSGCGTTTLTSETAGTTLTCSATNGAGLSNSVSVTVKIDKTAPTADPYQSPAANANGWNNTNVTVYWQWSDGTGSGLDSCAVSTVASAEGEYDVTNTCFDLAGNSYEASHAVKIDKTAPTANPYQSPAANANGWNNTNVTVYWQWSDGTGSGLDSCAVSTVASAEGEYNVTNTCFDLAGNSYEASHAVRIDKTAPTFAACPPGGPFYLNSGSQPVGPIGVDASISGLDAAASTLSGSVDTSSVGTKSVTFTAVDLAGNSATKTCAYSVIFRWTGFFQPVDNLPALNSVKAGSAVPVKFNLDGNQGLAIFAAGYPKSTRITCDTNAAIDEIEQTITAGGSSLTYDPVAGQYIYVWKTEKSWAGTCRQLEVKLIDGTSHFANFKFK